MIATPDHPDAADDQLVSTLEKQALRQRRLIRLRDAFERLLLRIVLDGVPAFDAYGRPVMDKDGKQVMTIPASGYISVVRHYLHDVAPDISRHQHGALFEALKTVRERNRDGFGAEPDEGQEEVE
jgi:hypothetical protein